MALKNDDFRKISSKLFSSVKYHESYKYYLKLAFRHDHDVLLPSLPRPTAFFLLSLALRREKQDRASGAKQAAMRRGNQISMGSKRRMDSGS